MKRLLTISFICFLALPCFAQRVTKIITSLDSNTSEVVTINTAWTGTDGDLILSASVPASVKVGDTITDANTNTYLITGISGSTLTSQDFDTTTDPATGSATIQDAYAGGTAITAWEADWEDTALYVSGDSAQGEMYNNITFADQVTINGGTTIGLGEAKLTVPTSERHDGTEGTGAVGSNTGSGAFISSNSALPKVFEWFEIDIADQDLGGVGRAISISSNSSSTIRNLIVHDLTEGSAVASAIFVESLVSATVINNIIYNVNSTDTGSDAAFGINILENNCDAENNTVWNVVNDNGSGDAIGIQFADQTTDTVRNNISMDMSGSSSGARADFNPASVTNATEDFNAASDTSPTGSNSIESQSSSDFFVSTSDGSEDLHLKSGANAIDDGLDLGTTPAGINFDINNRDRDAEGDVWDMGAHEFVAAAVAAARRKQILGQ